MEAWLRSRERLEETRAHLKAEDLTEEQKKALICFERCVSKTFKIIPPLEPL